MSDIPARRLRLHGYAVSNYFNIARAALIEKHAAFDVVTVRASQEAPFLAVSPMGKIPVLETPQGWLAETVAILEYLEDTIAAPALHPADPFARARGRQIINIVQMYIEAPVRSLFPGVFFGAANERATVNAARTTLDRATAALNRLVAPQPFLLGTALSYADLFAFYCLDIAQRVTRFVYDRPILAELNGFDDWRQQLAARESTHLVMADFHPTFAAYLIEHNSAYSLDHETKQLSAPGRAGVGA